MPYNPLNNRDNPALDAIRTKLRSLYANEPSARMELDDAEKTPHRSKHQEYIHNLNNSGKSLAEIQVEWHNYYKRLPDDEKHAVWQEFYNHHNQSVQTQQPQQPAPVPKAAKSFQQKVVEEVRRQSRTPKNQHVQSLLFGLSAGSIVILIFLFGFFNERFIAPFITPSKVVSSTPIIIDPDETKVSDESKVIIPKINVEIPVVYDEKSIGENDFQNALEDGVVHYATTSQPGEKGNAAIFGHSSNNIFNSGKYKFAFVLLNRLEAGDTFMLHKDGTRYVYRVFDKKVVSPTDFSVLEPIAGKQATVSLITCDPPGTSLNRLVVVGEQITPSPSKNVASTAENKEAAARELPGPAPSLWSRLTSWL